MILLSDTNLNNSFFLKFDFMTLSNRPHTGFRMSLFKYDKY